MLWGVLFSCAYIGFLIDNVISIWNKWVCSDSSLLNFQKKVINPFASIFTRKSLKVVNSWEWAVLYQDRDSHEEREKFFWVGVAVERNKRHFRKAIKHIIFGVCFCFFRLGHNFINTNPTFENPLKNPLLQNKNWDF